MLNNIFIFLNYANKYQFLKKSFFLQFKDNSVGNLKCMFSFIYINLSLKVLSMRQRRDIFWLEQRVPKEQKKAKVENPRPREKASMRRVSAFVCFNQRIFFFFSIICIMKWVPVLGAVVGILKTCYSIWITSTTYMKSRFLIYS